MIIIAVIIMKNKNKVRNKMLKKNVELKKRKK